MGGSAAADPGFLPYTSPEKKSALTMGNLSIGNFRSDAPSSDQASREKCVTRRISSSVTYYYSPLSEAGGPPKPEGGFYSSLSPPAQSVTDSSSCTDDSSSDSTLFSGDQSNSSSSSRPLLVFFSWFGAKPGPVAKYRDLYLARGLDVLWVQSSVMHFLWPRWGLDYSLKVLNILEEPQFSKRPLLVHAASIGGYTFTQLLSHVAHGEKRHRDLAQRVKGQIYDSLVAGNLEYMAIGLGKTLLPRLHGLIKHAAMFYFWLFKRHTADFYDRLVQVFRYSPVATPALFFYSEDDVMCHTATVEDVMALWRKRGVAVHGRKWEESIHAAHMRCHPEEYLSTLQHFLNSLSLSSLKAEI